MDNLFDLTDSLDYKKLASDKIDEELKSFKGDKKGEAVKKYVADTLKDFCLKNRDFAKVVYLTKRTLSDCIASAMKGCGNSISDIEVYRRVAKFYFPNSEVEFQMNIVVGQKPDDKYLNKESKKTETKNNDDISADKPKKKKSKKENPAEIESDIIQLPLF